MGFSDVKEKADAIQKAVEEASILVGPPGVGKVPGVNVPTGLKGLESYSRGLRQVSDGLKTSMFKTLFMGTFKNGKSTTINAILGRELLPVAVTACTAVISQVVYGTDASHVRVFKAGSSTPEVLTLERFNKEYKLSNADKKLIEEVGSLDRFSDIDYVLLENNSELFQDGVQLIDSPGLEEAVSRTKATEQFFPQANAIIFVLDATKLLSNKEKLFIKQHFVFTDPKPRNVFFVVNRFNQVNSDEEREEVRQEAEDMLAPVFTVNGVLNSELMKKRLFFVDAYGAYQMKKNGQVPVGTGMVEFQRELEAFLTSEDRVLARYQSVVANMAAVCIDAKRQIAETEQVMRKPLTELKDNAAESEKKLAELEKDIKSMANTIRKTESLVESKIMGDLEKFLTVDLPNIWRDHATTYDQKFSIVDMVKLALPISDSKKEEILRPMTVFLNEFIEDQLINWSDRVSLLVQPEITNMQEDLEDRGKDFSFKLTMAHNLFSGASSPAWDNNGGANKLQLALSLIQGDVSVAVENAAGGNFNWGEFAKRYVVQAVINILVASLIGGGIPGLIVLAVIEMVQMGLHAGSTRDRLLNGFADRLFPKIADEMLKDENRGQIVGDIRTQFLSQEEQVTGAARGLIKDEREKQAKILQDKERTEAQNRLELERQNTLLEEITKRTEFVYRTLYNREATPEKLEKLAASIATGQGKGA